jgi:putative transposase
MPRIPVVRSRTNPFHVTFRGNNRERFHLPLEEVWKILEEEVLYSVYQSGIQPHAVLLMPNHVHMSLSTPEEDIGKSMQGMLSRFTKRLNSTAGRSGRAFGAKYYGTLITHQEYWANVIRYIYQNPVRAGITVSVLDWPYSTLAGLTGAVRCVIPIFPFKDDLFELTSGPGLVDQLDWLQQTPSRDELEFLQKAFRKKELR